MDIVRCFLDYDHFNSFIRSKISDYYLGSGSEGICYLGKDGLVYKIFYKDIYKYNKFCRYDVDSFVNNVDVLSYAFPINLFCVDKKVVGYTSKYVKNDLLLNNFIINGYKDINGNSSFSKASLYDFVLDTFKLIDFDLMKDAYKRLCMDTFLISKKGIKINDINNNILFDGNSFIVVDTSNYSIVNENTIDRNLRLVDNAIKNEVLFLYDLVSSVIINRDCDFISLIDSINTIINHLPYNKEKINIKRRIKNNIILD